MPYRITRHGDDLVWVTLEGHLSRDHAENYYAEMWSLLEACPMPTDLLVDGRYIAGASPGARRRTEEIAHHPHLGHLAFVVNTHHLLIFAPLVKLVSGIGLFGDEYEALQYLRGNRGTPPHTVHLDLPSFQEYARPSPAPMIMPEPEPLGPPPTAVARAVAAEMHSPSRIITARLDPPPPLTPRTITTRHSNGNGGRPSYTRPLPPPPAPRVGRNWDEEDMDW